ncbi:MAG: formamidopyrimidine-DNA glycosylase, partial [Actinomycetota bacterium]
SLTAGEASALHRSVRRILRAAIDARGSTFGDGAYVDTNGVAGAYAARHQVYGRAGVPCPACATTILRIVVAARGTHFCPSCQA